MGLRDIKFVDLKKSKLDKEKSNLETDDYRFKSGGKVYVDPRGITRSPDYKIKWGSLIRDGRDLMMLRFSFPFWDFVTPEDKIWPEGVKRNSDGHYQYGDAILIKCELQNYLDKIKKDRKLSEKEAEAVDRQFEQQVQKISPGSVVDKQQTADLTKTS